MQNYVKRQVVWEKTYLIEGYLYPRVIVTIVTISPFRIGLRLGKIV